MQYLKFLYMFSIISFCVVQINICNDKQTLVASALQTSAHNLNKLLMIWFDVKT